MLDLNITTIILEIINFLVLTALLYHFVFRPVIRRVEARAAEKERLRARNAGRARRDSPVKSRNGNAAGQRP
jgi:F0F1-type ATP synthase membrane subunit b/b'